VIKLKPLPNITRHRFRTSLRLPAQRHLYETVCQMHNSIRCSFLGAAESFSAYWTLAHAVHQRSLDDTTAYKFWLVTYHVGITWWLNHALVGTTSTQYMATTTCNTVLSVTEAIDAHRFFVWKRLFPRFL